MLRWGCLALLVAACGGGEDFPPPAASAVGGASDSDDARPGPAPAQVPDDNAAGEPSGSAGAAGEGGAGGAGIEYEPGHTEPEVAGVCPPGFELDAPEPQALGVQQATLLAMTPDELSVVFTAPGAETPRLFVADRGKPDDAFTPLELSLPEGLSAAFGATLTSDGLGLIVVRADQDGFAELERASRGEAFGNEPDVSRFEALNDQKPTSGRSVGFPVLSADGSTLYFVRFFGGALVVQSSLGDGARFDQGVEIDEFTLGGPEGEHKLLCGLASDQRAIFFADQASGHAMALFRSHDDAPFYDLLDLGERQGAVPNRDCSRIYSTVSGSLVAQRVR